MFVLLINFVHTIILRFDVSCAFLQFLFTVRASSVTSRGTSRQSVTAGPQLVQSFVGTHRSRKAEPGGILSNKKDGDVAHLPLFELAALTPKEHQVNVKKLRNFLDLHGECVFRCVLYFAFSHVLVFWKHSV